MESVYKLLSYYAQGILGGQNMPEDANPRLEPAFKENYHYFSLPMALNYQRNSYNLWEAALQTHTDVETAFVFKPEVVVNVPEEYLRLALVKYKLALQPQRHIAIWRTLCFTLVNFYESDLRNLFIQKTYDIPQILEEIQGCRKQDFPYLSGQKIANYWLYVLLHYASAPLKNKHALSVAPDTHVIQSSIRLGLVEPSSNLHELQISVTRAWSEVLSDSDLCPIDIHTPLWLWSRNNFCPTLYS